MFKILWHLVVNKCIANKFTPVHLSGTVLCPCTCCYFSFSCKRINCGQTGRMEDPSHFSITLLRLCSSADSCWWIPAKLQLDFFSLFLGWFIIFFLHFTPPQASSHSSVWHQLSHQTRGSQSERCCDVAATAAALPTQTDSSWLPGQQRGSVLLHTNPESSHSQQGV